LPGLSWKPDHEIGLFLIAVDASDGRGGGP